MAEWVCPKCTFSNLPQSAQCEMCGHTAPPAAGFWACGACTFAENVGPECEMCGGPRAAGESPPPAEAAGTDHAAELRKMGFDDARVKAALEATGGALEAAVQWLFDQDEGDELRHKLPARPPAAAPPPAPPAPAPPAPAHRDLSAAPLASAPLAAPEPAAVYRSCSAPGEASGAAAGRVAARSAGGSAAKKQEPPPQQRPRPAASQAASQASASTAAPAQPPA